MFIFIFVGFFRANPALLHRLAPWLNRELNVLLNANEAHVQFVMSRILDLITQTPIRSPRFSAAVSAYIGRHTEHFVHEFYSFASSPYDLSAYDRYANYVGRDALTHEVSEDDGNDSDVQVRCTVVTHFRLLKEYKLSSVVTHLLNRWFHFHFGFEMQLTERTLIQRKMWS